VPLLRRVSHLVNGSKHFIAEAKHHTSVKTVQNGGYVEGGYVEPGYVEDKTVIYLDEMTAEFGVERIEVLELAKADGRLLEKRTSWLVTNRFPALRLTSRRSRHLRNPNALTSVSQHRVTKFFDATRELLCRQCAEKPARLRRCPDARPVTARSTAAIL
jgi:hypothetical protein